MWSYITLANSTLSLILMYGAFYLHTHGKDKLFVNITGSLFIISMICFFQVYNQYKMEQTHEIEMTIRYIDQMSPLDLKNKLKTCMINQSNCSLVFVEQ